MSLIGFMRRFGLRSTVAKVKSVLALRFFGKAALKEAAMADLADLDGATSVDMAGMSAEYRVYVDEQISRSVRRSSYFNPIRALIGSRDRLIQRVWRVAESWDIACTRVLSIGCRDNRELDTIERLLHPDEVTGVDLFSASPRILTADMHDLPFEDNRFDISLAIHCMEHAYDASKSLAEMLRVTKNKGLLGIEVPLGFEVTEFDRNDFGGVTEMVSLFAPGSASVLWSEIENRDALSKPANLRMILQKND